MIHDRNCSKTEIETILTSFKPDIIGLSVLTGECILDAIKISKIARSKEIKVVWGGVHPTLFPEQPLKEKIADYVVRNEGELTMLELANALEKGKKLSGIEGLSYITNTSHHNRDRPFIEDLDTVPKFPWHLLNLENYITKGVGLRKAITLNTSRGCPYRCTFCYNQLVSKRRWRTMSVERIMEYILFLKEKYGINYINFLEDNFAVNRNRLDMLCDAIDSEKIDLKWECEMRVNTANKNLLTTMKKGGCMTIGFGVESGSQRMLDFMKKDITIEQVFNAFDLCKKLNIYADIYLMCGLPTETPQDFEKTIKLLNHVTYRSCDLMVYRPYPGTPMYEYCVQHKLFSPPQSLKEWSEISDQHHPRFTVGTISEQLLWKFIKKNRSKNLGRVLNYIIRETPPSTLFSRGFASRAIHYGWRLTKVFVTKRK